jgi:hypothetical protein
MAENPSDPSEALYRSWWTPAYALAQLPDSWSTDTKKRWIAERLRGGIIKAAANAFQRRIDKQATRKHVVVEASLWKGWSVLADHDFWANGDVTFYDAISTGYGGVVTVTFFSVRFEPDAFSEFIQTHRHSQVRSARSELPQADPPERNRGGRPAKEYWEPLLIEMARQLYAGDLQPRRQADIENAMHDWLASNGHQGGETQVRQRAKTLWEAIQK